jgi:hypothetical protein
MVYQDCQQCFEFEYARIQHFSKSLIESVSTFAVNAVSGQDPIDTILFNQN